MSSWEVGWTFRHSPLTDPGRFAVHLAIADVVNDGHGQRFFAALPWLAEKARVSRATAKRAVDELVEAGCLEILRERPGQTTEYRFLTPDLPQTWTPRVVIGVGDDAETSPRASRAGTPRVVIGDPARDARLTTKERQENETRAAETFDRFWTAYPRKVAKDAARKSWSRLPKDLDLDVVVAAAASYRDDPNRVDRFTAHPATWLNQGRWADETPQPAREAPQGHAPPRPGPVGPTTVHVADGPADAADRRRLAAQVRATRRTIRPVDGRDVIATHPTQGVNQ